VLIDSLTVLLAAKSPITLVIEPAVPRTSLFVL